MKYRYIGLFVDRSEFYKLITNVGKRLDKLITEPHVTFKYKPEVVDTSLFGEQAIIRLIAYGNDNINEGFKVEVQLENQKLQEMYNKILIPHITASISNDGKAVNTAFLHFEDLNKPIEINATFNGVPEDEQYPKIMKSMEVFSYDR